MHVTYIRGKEIFLADTLSRAHPPEVHVCDFSRRLETVNPADLLAMPIVQLNRFKQFSAGDPVLQVL